MRHLLSHAPATEAPHHTWRGWLIALALSAAGFVATAHAVRIGGGVVSGVDQSAWLRAPRAEGLVGAAIEAFSRLHGTTGLAALSAALALLLFWRRNAKQGAALVVLAMVGGLAFNNALKVFIARPRPAGAELPANAQGYGFPSGHVMLATVLYGLVLLSAWSLPLRPWPRFAMALGAAGAVALVAIGRIWSGAHYPSDVLAAVLAGIAWLSLLAVATHLADPPRKA